MTPEVPDVEALTQITELVIDFSVRYSFQLLGALILVGVGFLVGGWISRTVLRLMESRNVDVTLRQFIASTTRVLIVGGFLIIALQNAGISITPFIAAIGGLAVGISFAVQGPVANYGAGIAIILTRLFRVGDTITSQAQSGLVEEITLAHTILRAEDGEEVLIPNKHIVGEVIINSHAVRVVEGSVGISYDADPQVAIDAITAVLQDDPEVANEPAPQVGIQAFGDFAVELSYRYWVPTGHYFPAQHRINLAVYRSLQSSGIEIPFPVQNVRLHQTSGN